MHTQKLFFALFCCLSLPVVVWSQGAIVFSTDDGGNHRYWKVKAETFSFYENISAELDNHDLYNGYERGPISISPNGQWYVFRSTRFNLDAYNATEEALTICNDDFSTIETITTQGNARIAGAGLAQVSNTGDTIFFSSTGGTHALDIFYTYRLPGDPLHWHEPLELSSGSAYMYNTNPQVSYDRSVIVFDAGNTAGNPQEILSADVFGTITNLLSASSIPGCSGLHSGTIDANEFLYVEANTDTRRTWIKMGANAPVAIDNTLTNDRSPFLLPDGRVCSLHSPLGTPQVKVMYNDASGLEYASYTDKQIADIGTGAGEYVSSVLSIAENNTMGITVYPNPASSFLLIETDETAHGYRMIDMKGVVVQEQVINFKEIILPVSSLPAGFYILEIKMKDGIYARKKFIKW